MSQSLLSIREKVVVTDNEVFAFFDKEETIKKWIERTLEIHLKGDILDNLHNGIILCYLMKKLDDNSIPRIQEQTTLTAKLLENIRFFLSAVIEYGVPRHKLFFETDLWEKSNRVRIIECLEELARISKAKGFENSLKEEKLDEKARSKLDNILIQNVRQQLSNQPKSPSSGVYRKEAPGLFKRKLQLLLGQSDFPEFERRLKRIQALIKTRLVKRVYLDRIKKHSMRTKIVKELYDTETSYVNSLKICINDYLIPLRDGTWNKKLKLDRNQIKTLFSDIEVILNFNITLQTEIETRIQTWSPSHVISDIFLRIMSFLKVYSNYVASFDRAIAIYEDLMKTNKLFPSFIADLRVTKSNGLDLPSLLIMPIQRVPRYYMLLENFLKNTWREHRDYEDLEKVVNGLKEMSMYLNEKKRDYENMQILISLQDLYFGGPNLCVYGRRFIEKFQFFDPKKKSDVMIFLFSDIIMVTRFDKKSTKYEYKADYEVAHIMCNMTGEVIELNYKNVLITTLHSKSNSGEVFIKKLSEIKNSGNKDDDLSDDGSDDEVINPEELLRLREIEKKNLKKTIEQEQNNDTRPHLRTTTSLLRLRAIVEEQIDVVKESKITSPRNLDDELEELNQKIQIAKSSLEPKDLKEVQYEEEQIEIKKKKKKRRIFKFFKPSNKKKLNKSDHHQSHIKTESFPEESKKKRLSFHSVDPKDYSKEDNNELKTSPDGRKRAATTLKK